MLTAIILGITSIYMGGHHDFGPFGGDTSLHVGSGEESVARVTWTPGEPVTLSALMTSPLHRRAENGIGFTLTDSVNGGKLDLILLKQPCGDAIYSTERLNLRVVREGVATDTLLDVLPENYVIGSDAAFTLSVMPAEAGEAEIAISSGEFGSHKVWEGLFKLTPSGVGGIGFIAGEGAQFTVDRAVLTYHEPVVKKQWPDREDIMAQLQSEQAPYAGLWCTLDHNLDSNFVRPGGDYLLAFMPVADGGYELIYIEGAKINAAGWLTGMLKGQLKPTRMAGLYHARWLDAESDDIDGQAILQFTGTDLCVLTLPSLGSTIRLHRVATE